MLIEIQANYYIICLSINYVTKAYISTITFIVKYVRKSMEDQNNLILSVEKIVKLLYHRINIRRYIQTLLSYPYYRFVLIGKFQKCIISEKKEGKLLL